MVVQDDVLETQCTWKSKIVFYSLSGREIIPLFFSEYLESSLILNIRNTNKANFSNSFDKEYN